LHIWPPAHALGRAKFGSFRAISPSPTCGRAKLGSFCTIRLRCPPGAREIGFVLHNLPRHPPAVGPNWVSFAHLASGARPGPGEIGFVLCNLPRHPPAVGPNWVRFARFASGACPGPGEIGFVLRISPPEYSCGEVGNGTADQHPMSRSLRGPTRPTCAVAPHRERVTADGAAGAPADGRRLRILPAAARFPSFAIAFSAVVCVCAFHKHRTNAMC
jgi:hypothetical protein